MSIFNQRLILYADVQNIPAGNFIVFYNIPLWNVKLTSRRVAYSLYAERVWKINTTETRKESVYPQTVNARKCILPSSDQEIHLVQEDAR